jgi:putative ABC transport system ATP-binding protein
MNHQRHQLSGGQQQRVAIARALINKPPLILADEPTGNLDQKNGQDIIKLLEKINREENVTVLLITHDENIAERTHTHYHLIDGKLSKET